MLTSGSTGTAVTHLYPATTHTTHSDHSAVKAREGSTHMSSSPEQVIIKFRTSDNVILNKTYLCSNLKYKIWTINNLPICFLRPLDYFWVGKLLLFWCPILIMNLFHVWHGLYCEVWRWEFINMGTFMFSFRLFHILDVQSILLTILVLSMILYVVSSLTTNYLSKLNRS